MSGIVGIVELKGRPLDRSLLAQMTEFMDYRGPDASDIWVNGCVGLGHTLLRSTLEADNKHQPCSLDGRTWITADARLDGRDELIQKLKSTGLRRIGKTTDAELILHAYQVWGENLAQHLLGDFAFAIWDNDRRLLFCARDHFGVKPFYYVRIASRFIFSNTLNCIRIRSAVSDKLNERAVADFLTHGYNTDLHATAFADIQRLAPAHTLTVPLQMPPKRRRYWHLPVEKLIRYNCADDYLSRFRELLNKAVSDRLRTNRAGVLMSGGLDSTSVAATASRLLSEQFSQVDLHACTFIFEHLITDEERYYSQIAAQAIGIPIIHLTQDDDWSDENWHQNQPLTPEPLGAAMITRSPEQIRRLAADFRVGLTGQGGDPALHPAPLNLKRFLKGLLLEGIAVDTVKYMRSYGRLPRLGLRTKMRDRMKNNRNKPPAGYPPWLRNRLAKKLDRPVRWENLTPVDGPIDTVRAQAYQYITSPLWTNLFENYDPGVTGFTIELRHPFFDLRLLAFLLALPPVPWCVDKNLLRIAMTDVLPGKILNRPKSPLPGFPIYERLRKTAIPDLDSLVLTPGLDAFVDIDRFLKMARNPEKLRPQESDLITRPLDLAIWLDRIHKINSGSKTEEYYGFNRQKTDQKTVP